jgi:AraC-like DNA-binding protein
MALRAMKSSEATFRLTELFDYLEDVLAWVKDRDGRYLWANRALLIKYALEHPGYDGLAAEAKVIGRTDYDLSPPFLADQFRLDDEQVLAGNRIVNRIERVVEAAGAVGWNVTNKIPIFNDEGTIVGTAGTTRVLTNFVPPKGASSNFTPVLAYMRDHFQNPIANEELAKVSRMSLRTFERQFLASFHVTPQKYLRKLRLSVATRSLIYTQQSLSELALSCGFGDQSHFTREFRRQFGRTPREYREYYRKASVISGTKTAAFDQSFAATRR